VLDTDTLRYSHANANPDAYTDTYAHSHAYSNSDAHSHTDSNPHTNTNYPGSCSNESRGSYLYG
jgi:hypothetical protein